MSLPSNQAPLELAPPLLSISLVHYLELICRSWEGYAVIPSYLAEVIKGADPLEEHHHLIPLENPTLFKIYPAKVWRESAEKRRIDKEASEGYRTESFAKSDLAKVLATQIQRKRDIITEVRADLTRYYKSKGKEILQSLGGNGTWQQQVDVVDYFIYRLLMGKNEKVRAALGFIPLELTLEFQELPVDKEWRNKQFQADLEMEREERELGLL